MVLSTAWAAPSRQLVLQLFDDVYDDVLTMQTGCVPSGKICDTGDTIWTAELTGAWPVAGKRA